MIIPKPTDPMSERRRRRHKVLILGRSVLRVRLEVDRQIGNYRGGECPALRNMLLGTNLSPISLSQSGAPLCTCSLWGIMQIGLRTRQEAPNFSKHRPFS